MTTSKAGINSQSGNRLDTLKTINGQSLEGGGNIEITGGDGGGAVWGEITGTLSQQTDLQNALNLKVATNRSILTAVGSGLAGGGNLTDNRSLSLSSMMQNGGLTGYIIPARTGPLMFVVVGGDATRTINLESLNFQIGDVIMLCSARYGSINLSISNGSIDSNYNSYSSPTAPHIRVLAKLTSTTWASTVIGVA